MKNVLFSICLLFFAIPMLDAQYFGRNKPRYRSFDFKVVETPHFRIHHYLKNDSLVNELAKMSEQWYINHKKIFGKDIDFKNPIIFYNNHAEFQQTNSISGEIGIGTGGVTEGLKNRVILPLTFSLQSTHHVLAHELVHAFQYNNIINGDSTSIKSLSNTPLWMVEGLAEYLSTGRIDPFTSMWMRDAILNNDLPDISKMDNPKYFPYRYGQAMMAFLGGLYGDNTLNALFMNTAMYGLESGFEMTYGLSTESMSILWHQAINRQYSEFLDGKQENPPGKKLISNDNSGRINVSPSLSPNGKYVVFLSEKDVFTTDLFLADVSTGKILNKVVSTTKFGHLDYINAMESTGAWSPNGKDFAFVGIKKGKSVLVIADADAGKTIETIEVSNLDAFINPVYHPNNKEVIVTGLMNGQTDLYSINLRTKKATQLTDDFYSENMVNISPDGKSLAFCYDKRSAVEGRTQGKYTYDLAEMDWETKEIKILDFFHGADNMNPVYDFKGDLYFVSDRDGVRNLYQYQKGTGKVLQMTDLLTGISGISSNSSMITTSSKKDRILYTHYFKNQYSIYEVTSDQLLQKEVPDVKSIDMKNGTLPITGLNKPDYVGANFRNADIDLKASNPNVKKAKYKPNFKLDYIGGGAGVGVAVNNNSFRNASGLQGGIDMLFGDLLGNNQLYSQLALNGDFLDIGGMVSYINRKNRLAWGVGLSHVPLRTGYQNLENTSIRFSDGVDRQVIKESTNLIRVFDQNLSLFGLLPFSTTLRLEGGIAGNARSFRWDEYNNYYLPIRQGNTLTGYQLVGSDKKRIPTEDELQLDQYYTVIKGLGASANIGLVGDNSYFGLTAPLAGHRFRVNLEKFIGNDDYLGVLVDGRKYLWMKPVSLAFRATSYSRFVNKTNSVYPNYIGTMGFVRGLGSILSSNVENLGISFSQLLGSKMLLGSFETRLPLSGPKSLSLIPSRYFLTDLNLFFDIGTAFDEFKEFSDGKELILVVRDANNNIVLDSNGDPTYSVRNVKPTIISSVGISLRINLFGSLIIEPYYARPLLKGGQFTFGLNLIPGW